MRVRFVMRTYKSVEEVPSSDSDYLYFCSKRQKEIARYMKKSEYKLVIQLHGLTFNRCSEDWRTMRRDAKSDYLEYTII